MEKWRGIVEAALVAAVLGTGSYVIGIHAETKALQERIRGLEADVVTVRGKQGDVRQRLTRVEAITELLYGKKASER